MVCRVAKTSRSEIQGSFATLKMTNVVGGFIYSDHALNTNWIGLLVWLRDGFVAVEAALEEAEQAGVPVAKDE